MAEVALEGVTKRFGQATAVNDLSLAIADGEFVVLLGPTGAGKTTTLRLVAGLEEADQGRITIASRDMKDNLAFPLRAPARRVPEDQIRLRVGEVAEMLRISKKLANKATQLSGGEMQRVAIGRALVRRPAIYLMDEPLSSLDAKLRSDLRLELKRIQADLGATVLFVTHDQIEAMTMADRIGVLDRGRLVQVGTPREIYEDPCNVYVASRLGQPQINLVPAGVLETAGAPGGTATIGIRTENLDIRPAKGAKATARIEWVEHLGDQNHVHIDIAGHRLVTLARPDDGLSVGDTVRLEPVRPLYFDANGDRLRA